MSVRTSDATFRDMIKREAEQHILKVSDFPGDRVQGKRKGAAFLKQVINDARVPPSWTPANLSALETPGQWLNAERPRRHEQQRAGDSLVRHLRDSMC
jgi:hypothetical protein